MSFLRNLFQFFIDGRFIRQNTIKLTFLDDVVDSFYTTMSGGNIDFGVTKNKIKIILPNSSTCCSMYNCSVFKFTSFLKEVFQRHKELHNLDW